MLLHKILLLRGVTLIGHDAVAVRVQGFETPSELHVRDGHCRLLAAAGIRAVIVMMEIMLKNRNMLKPYYQHRGWWGA